MDLEQPRSSRSRRYVGPVVNYGMLCDLAEAVRAAEDGERRNVARQLRGEVLVTQRLECGDELGMHRRHLLFEGAHARFEQSFSHCA